MFWLGLFIGLVAGWFFTRLWYSSHAKKEVSDTLGKLGNK
jgi:hypothetical protein